MAMVKEELKAFIKIQKTEITSAREEVKEVLHTIRKQKQDLAASEKLLWTIHAAINRAQNGIEKAKGRLGTLMSKELKAREKAKAKKDAAKKPSKKVTKPRPNPAPVALATRKKPQKGADEEE